MTRSLSAAFLRLFTVQGSWNYERLLGLGFGVAEEPLLRDLASSGNGPAYRAAVARGARFFNSHPYLAGLAVGAAARAEHEGVPPEQIERLRAALCGPLGALGDRIVWAGWLPLVSAAALAAVALGAGGAAVVGFLLLYNAGHLALRWWALRAGWEHGVRVGVALHHPILTAAGRIIPPVMAVALGFALPLVAQILAAPLAGDARLMGAAGAAAGFAVLRWRPAWLSSLGLGLALIAAALLVGWAWW